MPRKFLSRLTGWWHRPMLRRRVLLGAGAVGLFFFMLAWGAWTRVCAGGSCPSIAGLQDYDPDQASKVFAADGRLITDYGLQRRTVIGIKQMSPAIPAAFLAVEDQRFYQHRGVDWWRVGGAFWHNVKSLFGGGVPQGFSTITMQLAGNLWPEQIDRSQRQGFAGLTRKLREIRMAFEIERNYPKDRILELYLNQITLGNGAYGVEAAAQRYFGKSARSVNVAEAAMLAALAKGPSRYNPRRNPRRAVQRRNLVISMLEDSRKITPESAEAWRAYPLALSSRSDYSGVAEYFVEYVRQILTARFGADLYRAGFRIHTTIDLDVQEAAERALEQQLQTIEDGQLGQYPHRTYRQYLEARKDPAADEETGPFSPYLQGLVVTIEAKTGYIRAMVGGRDFEDNKWNRATQALRQAGSTFKPFVYAAALRAGIPLSQIFEDSPVSVTIPDQPVWEPKNYDSQFDGPMPMRRALYQSVNTIAVKVGLQLGEDAVISEAANFGLSTRIPAVPSIFIGSADVIPLELIGAYTAFANLGVRTAPQGILRVEDREGNLVWEPEVRETRVMEPEHAWLMLDGLRDVVRRGTAYSNVYARGFTLPAGGKTGTTNDGMDVWFIGFTPELVTGVWMGFDKKTKIKGNAQGGLLAAPAWTTLMKEIYERRRPPAPWLMPEGIIQHEIDVTSGFLSTPFCPRESVGFEYFSRGTEPLERCPVHSPFRGGP
ncbi:MAG TPA: PBP1A family penicillin-binding protein [Gemmatimonadales bacterium]|nr:PBP1A family penicillin-binding protein [Gemmatimonadales bacterium]